MEVQTAADNSVEIPDVLLEDSTDNTISVAQVEPVANITDASETLEDILDAATAQVTQPIELTPAIESGNIENQDPKTNNIQNNDTELPKEAGTFNLGVAGLKFSSTNVKTAKDGTKMVQIHQSQITPDQLLALQNNPNIKVVFRHVPSGKSYTKPPRHLLPPGYSSAIKKRKALFMEEELEIPDVYSFDEGKEMQGLAKRARLGEMRAKYMHGYGSGKKKGKPRSIPDSGSFSMSYGRSNLPAKVILTDLLARVNNPNAKKEVKLHTSQITAEVLANMELNLAYKIVLTTKQELPPLVIENVDAEEQAKLEQDAEEIEKQEKENAEETVKQEKENEPMGADEEEEKNIEEVEPEQERQEEEQEKELELKQEAREKKPVEEEKRLKKSATQTLVSRSGRIRKPSRFSLDIARLTKRKIPGVSGSDSSADESEQEPKSNQARKSKAQETVTSPLRAKAKEKVTSPGKVEGKKTKEEDEEKRKTEEEKKKAEREKKEAEEEMKKEEEKKRELEGSEKKVGNKTEVDQEMDDKTEKYSEQDVTESEKEVSSTENAEKTDEKDSMEGEKKDQETDVASVEPDTSTDAGKTITNTAEKTDEVMDVDEPFSLKLTEEEEKEVIDNKFRLRKLLEQCSTEEIRSMLLPEAFDSINIGDFLLCKAGQMHNSSGKVSFPRLYKEFEKLHKDASKEATRYNTLVRRANKVGGDKRMEKIVLMPVYNIEAANSLKISNSSIDAQICGIQRTITAEMIAANSFFMKSKMNTPIIRLKFPNITAPKNVKPKQKRPLYTNQYQQPFVSNQQQEPDSTTPDRPRQQKTFGQKISSMKYNVSQMKSQMTAQVRRPAYIEQLKTTGQINLGGHNHQFSTKSQEKLLQNIPVDATDSLRSDVQSSQMVATATAALAQLQATVDQQQAEVSTTNPIGQAIGTAETTLVSSATNTSGQPEQFFVTEDGVPVGAATSEDGEDRKQLVPIGDGQYVELPEGYSLIQTNEGYIIGQPGSTFTQGEDGNVYITNSDGTTTEITQQDVSGATDSPNIVDAVTEG